jgi:hypothetical protein
VALDFLEPLLYFITPAPWRLHHDDLTRVYVYFTMEYYLYAILSRIFLAVWKCTTEPYFWTFSIFAANNCLSVIALEFVGLLVLDPICFCVDLSLCCLRTLALEYRHNYLIAWQWDHKYEQLVDQAHIRNPFLFYSQSIQKLAKKAYQNFWVAWQLYIRLKSSVDVVIVALWLLAKEYLDKSIILFQNHHFEDTKKKRKKNKRKKGKKSKRKNERKKEKWGGSSSQGWIGKPMENILVRSFSKRSKSLERRLSGRSLLVDTISVE